MRYRFSGGNTLTEYVLIGAVITVAAIPAMINLVGSMAMELDWMGFVLSNGQGGNTQAAALNLQGNGLGFQNGVITRSNGQYTLSGYSASALGQQIEVAGSSGGILTVSNTLSALASQMEASGEDASLVRELHKLAERGHKLSTKVNFIENNLQKNIDFASRDGVISSSDSWVLERIHDPNVETMASLNHFRSKLNNLKPKLANYPDIDQIISLLSHDIDTTSLAFKNEADALVQSLNTSTGNKTGVAAESITSQMGNMNQNVASTIVHNDSTQIHNTGTRLAQPG